jgi:hypothetical protein
MASVPSQRQLRSLRELNLTDFSGGLNLRDAYSELRSNETPDCMNVTLDERGGVVKRLGYTLLSGSLPAAPTNIFYWKTGQVTILQIGPKLYKTSAFAAFTEITLGGGNAFTTSAKAQFVDFLGKLVYVHPVDGVFNSDGVTATLSTAAVKGTCIAAWQNKLWVGGDSSNPTRLWAGNAGSYTTFTTATDWVDIREQDDAIITALGNGQGMDVIGRSGLLVFKSRSTYRVNSSNATTGFTYTTLDTKAGAAGPNAVAAYNGRVAAFSEAGIYMTDGVTAMVPVSEKLSPLFQPTSINYSALSGVAAGVYRDRIFFSFPFGAAQTTNNRTLEFHPLLGWIVPHDFAMKNYTTYGKNSDVLYGIPSSGTSAFQMFSSGADNGAAITARFQTNWFEPTGGNQVRLRRLRVAGRGLFNLYVKTDYSTGQGLLANVDITGNAFTWNSFTWNVSTSVWGPATYEGYQDFFSLGNGKSVSFKFTETGSTSSTAPSLLGDGVALEVGSFACYGVQLEYVGLGYS